VRTDVLSSRSVHWVARRVCAAIVLGSAWGATGTAGAQRPSGAANGSGAMADTGAMASMNTAMNTSMGTAMDGALMNAPHMRMTTLTAPAPGDSARAAAVLTALRAGIAPYADFHRALADGYHIFGPKVPQPVYHFTSNRRAMLAMVHFDPSAPTSLLYVRTGDSAYRLVGAMYTARRGATLADLNERIPLSMGEWHVHTNWCLPKLTELSRLAERGPDGRPLFGGRGSITTETACEAAGGRFHAQIFGWMLHVYPDSTTPAAIWGRDAMHEMAGDHD